MYLLLWALASLPSKDLPIPLSYVTLGADRFLNPLVLSGIVAVSSLAGQFRNPLPAPELSPHPAKTSEPGKGLTSNTPLPWIQHQSWVLEGTWLSLLIWPQLPEAEGGEASLLTQALEDSYLLQG